MVLCGQTRLGGRQEKTDQPATLLLRVQFPKAAATDEKWLVAGNGPLHLDFARCGHGIGILSDDHMAFFQCQVALANLFTHWSDIGALARYRVHEQPTVFNLVDEG